jgi:hypothetical protein
MTKHISVTFEIVTEACATDGPFADHGWIHPETEVQRSLVKGGKRMYERNLRMARAGRFDWPSLRAAITFIEDNTSGNWDYGQVDSRLVLRKVSDGYDIVCGRNGYEYGESVSHTLHVEGVSAGTLARICRYLENSRSVRFGE